MGAWLCLDVHFRMSCGLQERYGGGALVYVKLTARGLDLRSQTVRIDASGRRVPAYAAPARATDLSSLPPAYSFVSTGEPFYDETVAYFDRLREAGVDAQLDVYEGLYHAFDMLEPDLPQSRQARERFCEQFAWAMEHCFA